jgi:hypothetical protein
MCNPSRLGVAAWSGDVSPILQRFSRLPRIRGGLGTPYANVATGLEIGLFARLEPGCQAESRQLRVGERPLLEVGIRR